MGKIAQVSAKYIIHSSIEIDGMVDRPDVIGAIFGQTEGLLGSDLELRELQRSGRIGRIEVNVDTKTGKTKGSIIIPSSLDKAETSIVGAALEIIQRIGPCNAKIRIGKIEDVRISKRQFVIDRAKELLKSMMDDVLPDSQELADEVSHSVRVMEITSYGPDKLAAGPAVEDADEITLVEGRADVLNLLKHGIKNAISINGTSVPQTIIELSKKKIVTVFVDGDRGGDLIIKELLNVAEIDFIAKAPDGKEVEEITKKEIHKALRSKISAEQMKLEISTKDEARENSYNERRNIRNDRSNEKRRERRDSRDNKRDSQRDRGDRDSRPPRKPAGVSDDKKAKFETMLEDLIGTRGAYILNENLEILGKVPFTELAPTVKSLNGGIYAVVFDGEVTKELTETAEKASVKCLVGMESKVKANATRLAILTPNDF